MKLSASLVQREIWKVFESQAHKELFGEQYKSDFRDYHYTVLVNAEDGRKFCYATIKELDSESVYMNFGGTFKEFRSKGSSYQGFHEIVECLKQKYKRVGFACRTKNTAMIKLGLNEGFEIVGLRLIYGFPSVEFLLERGA